MKSKLEELATEYRELQSYEFQIATEKMDRPAIEHSSESG